MQKCAKLVACEAEQCRILRKSYSASAQKLFRFCAKVRKNKTARNSENFAQKNLAFRENPTSNSIRFFLNHVNRRSILSNQACSSLSWTKNDFNWRIEDKNYQIWRRENKRLQNENWIIITKRKCSSFNNFIFQDLNFTWNIIVYSLTWSWINHAMSDLLTLNRMS